METNINVTGVRTMKHILITVALCAMSFAYGHSVQPDVKPLPAAKPIYIETQVPVCAPLPVPKMRMIRASELRE